MINVMLVSEETGEETVYGEVGPQDAWWSIPLPPCPSCNGTVEWAEAGQVPGTRRCTECKRFYQLRTVGSEVADTQETVRHPIRCCWWCGSRFRPTPGPDGDGQRWCSDECSYDSRNLSEEER